VPRIARRGDRPLAALYLRDLRSSPDKKHLRVNRLRRYGGPGAWLARGRSRATATDGLRDPFYNPRDSRPSGLRCSTMDPYYKKMMLWLAAVFVASVAAALVIVELVMRKYGP